MIKHICFDLDGTLVQSNKTIYKATLKSLEELNIENNFDEEKFNEMIGMHFIDIFDELGIDVPDFDEFIGIYKKVYFNFIEESELYPQVEAVLSQLSNSSGIKISLLTTKAQDQAEKIISYFGLNKYFDFVMGRRNGVGHKPSAEPLLFICDEIGEETGNTMIVGDTELDILCGRNAGAFTCGVTYGYRTRESLSRSKPDYLIDDLSEINSIIKNNL